jgi:short-subunit dehydrogenase
VVGRDDRFIADGLPATHRQRLTERSNLIARAAAHETPQCVVITGASRGLGRALAMAYARPGCLLGLTARDAAALDDVAVQCRLLGADVVVRVADVTEPGALLDWVVELDGRRSIDLLIANAGLFDGRRPGAAGEGLESAIGQLRVNLEGAVRTIDAVVPLMLARGRGHVAAISSLAAVYPLADAPAYSASKAGLVTYCDGLRELLAPSGIAVSVVYPGHIATRQTEAHEGGLPLLMTAETAARRIQAGLARGRSRIWLPTSLALFARIGGLLPPKLRHLTGRGFRFRVRDSSGSG